MQSNRVYFCAKSGPKTVWGEKKKKTRQHLQATTNTTSLVALWLFWTQDTEALLKSLTAKYVALQWRRSLSKQQSQSYRYLFLLCLFSFPQETETFCCVQCICLRTAEQACPFGIRLSSVVLRWSSPDEQAPLNARRTPHTVWCQEQTAAPSVTLCSESTKVTETGSRCPAEWFFWKCCTNNKLPTSGTCWSDYVPRRLRTLSHKCGGWPVSQNQLSVLNNKESMYWCQCCKQAKCCCFVYRLKVHLKSLLLLFTS